MLAWIFWPSRFAEVTQAEYQAALVAFHERIASAAPAGFLGSRTLRYDKVPWLLSPTEVYEDWYFVKASEALDNLDDAVLAAFTQDAHARVALLAATAVAGLYRLRSGAPLMKPPRCFWGSKPRASSYESFIARLSASGVVWSRKMVLGPTPEFCVESDGRNDLSSLAEWGLSPGLWSDR